MPEDDIGKGKRKKKLLAKKDTDYYFMKITKCLTSGPVLCCDFFLRDRAYFRFHSCFKPSRVLCAALKLRKAAAAPFTPAEIEPHSSAAFLQIRPGKADYSDRPPPTLPSYSSVGGGWVRVDIFRFVRCRYLTLPFQHHRGEDGQRSYMTLLASMQLLSIAYRFVIRIIFICNYHFFYWFLININSFAFMFELRCRIVCIVLKRMTDGVCVKRPERCVSISFSFEVEAVGLSLLLSSPGHLDEAWCSLLSKLDYSSI